MEYGVSSEIKLWEWCVNVGHELTWYIQVKKNSLIGICIDKFEYIF